MHFRKKLGTVDAQKGNKITASLMAKATLLTTVLAISATALANFNNHKSDLQQKATELPQMVQQDISKTSGSYEFGTEMPSYIQAVAATTIIKNRFSDGSEEKYFDAAESKMANKNVIEVLGAKTNIHVTKHTLLRVALALQDMDQTGKTFKDAIFDTDTYIAGYEKMAFNSYQDNLMDVFRGNSFDLKGKDAPKASDFATNKEVVNIIDSLYERGEQVSLNKENTNTKTAIMKR